MFWGLIMEPGRCYTQTVKVAFHVSMAALDISNSTAEPSQVMCLFEERNYLLCTLNNSDKLQCGLDLNFEAGTKVSFATNGKSHVHLTGYLTAVDDSDLEEEEVEDEEEKPVSKKKKRAMETANQSPAKKIKSEESPIINIKEEVEDESSDDSDFDLDAELEEQVDEEGEEEEESELSDDLIAEEEEEAKKSMQNGLPKKKAQTQTPTQLLKVTPKTTEKQKKKEQKPVEKQKQPKVKKLQLKGGVIAEDLREGTGEAVKPGNHVFVYYEGRLKDNNKTFDSTTKGPGFSFRVGRREVIKGWDVGVVGMKVGGKRRIICPPNTAYGAKGSPPAIPANATLVFDIELKRVNH